MNIIKQLIAPLAICVAVVALGLSITANNHPVPAPIQKIVKGAGPDFSSSPVLTVNGINEWYEQQSFISQGNATTTLCSLPNPLTAYGGATGATSASTTLQFFAIRFTTASSSANLAFDVATSTSPAATSTSGILVNQIVSQATPNGYTWVNPGGTNATYQRNTEYLNAIARASSVQGTSGVQGFCEAEWTQY